MQESEKNISVKNAGITDKKRFAIRIGCALLAVILVAFAGLAIRVSAYDKIFPNVTAGGVDIGAVTKEKAAEILSEEFAENLSENIKKNKKGTKIR